MIAYDLQCANGHTFEGWFEDRKTYLDQQKKGLISCPVCNDTFVEIVPSTFAIKSSPSVKFRQPPTESEEAVLEKISREAIDFVEKNFDNVGCEFAKEALKIHYGAAEPRNIRGVSTNAEEQLLKDEGVEFFKIPLPAPPETDS